MKTVIVIANPKENSFNHAIADSIIKGLEKKSKKYEIWDLNKMGFNPVLSSEEFEKFGYGSASPDIINFIDVLTNDCDQIVFIYPLFYFDLPAILKGFFDRIFIGTLIKDRLEPVNWKPSIDIEETLMIQTSLGDNWSLAPEVSKETYDKVIKIFLDKIGLFNTEIIHYKNVAKSTLEERQEFLDNFTARFSK